MCLRYGIISRDMAIICPVDASGKFMSEVTDFKGLHVKVSINTKLHYRARSLINFSKIHNIFIKKTQHSQEFVSCPIYMK